MIHSSAFLAARRRLQALGIPLIAVLALGPAAVAVGVSSARTPKLDAEISIMATRDPNAHIQAVVSFTELIGAERTALTAKSVRIEQYFHAFRASDGTTWVGGYVVGTEESTGDGLKNYLAAEMALVSGAIDEFDKTLASATGPEATDLETQLSDLHARSDELSEFGIRVYAVQVSGTAEAVAALGSSDLPIRSIATISGTNTQPDLPWGAK